MWNCVASLLNKSLNIRALQNVTKQILYVVHVYYVCILNVYWMQACGRVLTFMSVAVCIECKWKYGNTSDVDEQAAS